MQTHSLDVDERNVLIDAGGVARRGTVSRRQCAVSADRPPGQFGRVRTQQAGKEAADPVRAPREETRSLTPRRGAGRALAGNAPSARVSSALCLTRRPASANLM